MTEEARIGVDRLLGGEPSGPFDSGTWWSRLGGGFVTPSMFWVPEWADATPAAEHVPFAFWVIDALRPFAVAELTARPGAFLAAFGQAIDRLQLPTRCHAVAHRVSEAFAAHHDARYAQFSQLVRLPAERVLGHIEDGSLDLLSIDLTESGVAARGLDAWLGKLSKRGIVLVHGISDAAIDGAAREFWEGLAEKYPYFTFLHGAGLGVFGVGADLPPALNQLFALHGVEPRALDVREMFARLGHALRVQAEFDELQRLVEAGGHGDQIARLEAALSATREALAAARVDHVKTLKRLRKVEESFWWRITKPLRRLVKNHRWAFYNMRQWIMCGFWIATLRFGRLKKQMRPYRHARLVLKSGLMHEAWYLRQYPDVAAVGVPPSLHYVLYGGFEGRDPSPLFSSQAYLTAYPDVMVAKTNPLVHYLQKGRYENRAIKASTARPPAPKQSSAAPSTMR